MMTLVEKFKTEIYTIPEKHAKNHCVIRTYETSDANFSILMNKTVETHVLNSKLTFDIKALTFVHLCCAD